MKLLGIEFAPINIPIKRRLQTLAAACMFITIAFGGFISIFLTAYLIFFTRLSLPMIIYCLWIRLYDWSIEERGGRRNEWVRDWLWWKYVRDYFPLKLKLSQNDNNNIKKFDEKKNYIFCNFPHGLLCFGSFNGFGTNASEFKHLFPKHQSFVTTLAQHFKIPIFRELALSLGGIVASRNAIEYLLNGDGGGKIIVIMPGGVAEAYYSQPGLYRLVLKNRKGFIRIALNTGTALVPVISFGETDLFKQLDTSDGSWFKSIQEWFRKFIGMAPILPLGRGFFQYTFGIIPQRRPVTTVVGTPLEIPQIINPTSEQIDEYHQLFIKHLNNLFEQEKSKYIENSDKTRLEII